MKLLKKMLFGVAVIGLFTTTSWSSFECGDPGTMYFELDLNQDCYVNLVDLAKSKIVTQWFWCTDPANPACDSYWQSDMSQADSASESVWLDDFSGATLDERWELDHRPLDVPPPGGEFHDYDAGGGAFLNSAEGLLEFQNVWVGGTPHLHTPVDTTQLLVRVDVNAGMVGEEFANCEHWNLAVGYWWDENNWGALVKARGKVPAERGWFAMSVIDGAYQPRSYQYDPDTDPEGGLDEWMMWGMELTDTEVKYYASTLADGSMQGITDFDSYMIELTDIGMARPANWTGPALIMVGKGYGSPDFDSQWDPTRPASYGFDATRIMGSGPREPACGNPGTEYLAADLNQDCYVNLGDFTEIMAHWLWCSDPGNPDCNQYKQYLKFVTVWEIDPYENFLKTRAPGPATPQIGNLQVQMSQDEFRDALFMVGPYDGGELAVDIHVETLDGLPEGMILVQETLYVYNLGLGGNQFTGDAVYPLTGPLVIPAGESRQVRLRFDGRYSGVQPGIYSFNVILTDVDSLKEQIIPGTVEVWDFNLPSTDELPNHNWVMIKGTEWSGDVLTNGIQEMKKYGLNYIFVTWTEMPQAVDVDENGNILSLNTSSFDYRVSAPLTAWQAGVGNEKLNYIFYLYDLSLGQTGDNIITYPSELWNTLFGNWISMMRDRLQTLYGITDDRWMLVLGDEQGADTLMDYTIPLAETIKAIDPTITLICNSSVTLSEPWASRYFAAFDIFQPNLQYYEERPALRTFLQSSGKELWAYKCAGYCGSVGFDIYKYYRSYAWRMVKYGMKGIGLWTYCVNTGGKPTYDWPGYNPSGTGISWGHVLAVKHWANDDVVHIRRYEMYRETVDDYRYILKLRDVAAQAGPQTQADAEALIDQATTDIIDNNWDHSLCDYWRTEIADEILSLEALP